MVGQRRATGSDIGRRAMIRMCRDGIRAWARGGALLGAIMLVIALAPVSQAAPPIRIGLGMALTGGLAANGKAALLAMEIWRDEVNQKGGLMGRPVELVYYDDQTKPAAVPGIYSKLLDVDNVRSEEHTSELQSQSNLV